MPLPGGFVDEGMGVGVGVVDEGLGVEVGLGEELEGTTALVEELDGLGVGVGVGVGVEVGVGVLDVGSVPGGGSNIASTQ